MIEVDISNIWCGLSLPDLLAIEREVAAAHEKLMESAQDLPWLELSDAEQQLEEIQRAADCIRQNCEICVIAAPGDLCLGPQAVMELLGCKGGPQILFTGDTLSTQRWNALNRQLEGKDFCLIALSQTGTTLESAIAFRGLRWAMERRYGTEETARRIYAVTQEDSALWQMASQQGWKCFAIPQGVAGSHTVLSPAGLLPMAVAGMDIRNLLEGARQARKNYDLRSFENPLWLYAGGRNALHRRGRTVELFGSAAPEFGTFGAWWQQLFAQSEQTGVFPAVVEYPRDIRCLGRRITEGGDIFETLVRYSSEEVPYTIGSDVFDLDGLNDLAEKTLEQIRLQAFQAAVAEHSDGAVPVITMDCGSPDEKMAGELLGFLEMASGLSACISGNAVRDV